MCCTKERCAEKERWLPRRDSSMCFYMPSFFCLFWIGSIQYQLDLFYKLTLGVKAWVANRIRYLGSLYHKQRVFALRLLGAQVTRETLCLESMVVGWNLKGIERAYTSGVACGLIQPNTQNFTGPWTYEQQNLLLTGWYWLFIQVLSTHVVRCSVILAYKPFKFNDLIAMHQ